MSSLVVRHAFFFSKRPSLSLNAKLLYSSLKKPHNFQRNKIFRLGINILLTGQVLAQEAGQSFAWASSCAIAGEVAAKSSIRNGTFMMITQ